MMTEQEFSKRSQEAIEHIERFIEDVDIEEVLEVDFLGDILNISSPKGMYVINKHTAAREIWVVSPVSGPWHFAFNSGQWISSKNMELLTLLREEIQTLL